MPKTARRGRPRKKNPSLQSDLPVVDGLQLDSPPSEDPLAFLDAPDEPEEELEEEPEEDPEEEEDPDDDEDEEEVKPKRKPSPPPLPPKEAPPEVVATPPAPSPTLPPINITLPSPEGRGRKKRIGPDGAPLVRNPISQELAVAVEAWQAGMGLSPSASSQMEARLYREKPERDYVEGQGEVEVKGFLETVKPPADLVISEEYIQRRYGGGTYRVDLRGPVISGPKTGTGNVILAKREYQIAGPPNYAYKQAQMGNNRSMPGQGRQYNPSQQQRSDPNMSDPSIASVHARVVGDTQKSMEANMAELRKMMEEDRKAHQAETARLTREKEQKEGEVARLLQKQADDARKQAQENSKMDPTMARWVDRAMNNDPIENLGKIIEKLVPPQQPPKDDSRLIATIESLGAQIKANNDSINDRLAHQQRMAEEERKLAEKRHALELQALENKLEAIKAAPVAAPMSASAVLKEAIEAQQLLKRVAQIAATGKDPEAEDSDGGDGKKDNGLGVTLAETIKEFGLGLVDKIGPIAMFLLGMDQKQLTKIAEAQARAKQPLLPASPVEYEPDDDEEDEEDLEEEEEGVEVAVEPEPAKKPAAPSPAPDEHPAMGAMRYLLMQINKRIAKNIDPLKSAVDFFGTLDEIFTDDPGAMAMFINFPVDILVGYIRDNVPKDSAIQTPAGEVWMTAYIEETRRLYATNHVKSDQANGASSDGNDGHDSGVDGQAGAGVTDQAPSA